MQWEAFITCAVTGAGATTDRSDRVPVTPEQIADAAIEAARAGAAIAHIHVRDPATGKGSRDTGLYRQVVERVRAADIDVVLNLTAGMGGDLVLGGEHAPLPVDAAGTDMVGAARTPRAHRRAAARDLHARLRHDELRGRRRLRHGQHAGDAARNGGAGARARRASRARGVRHRPPRARARPDPRRPDRRPGDGAALHGHPVRRAGRSGRRCSRWSPACPRGRCSPPSRSAACSCRTSRWPCSRAATSASGSRTTSTSRAACSPRTAQLVERAVAILEAMNVRVLGPDGRARAARRSRGTAERWARRALSDCSEAASSAAAGRRASC